MRATRALMKIRLLMLLFLLMALSSCAGLRPIDGAKQVLGAKEFEGRYRNTAENHQTLSYHNLSSIIDFRNKVQLPDVASIEIKILNGDDMLFLFVDNSGNSRPYASKYRFEDGKLLLKNKNFRLTGIPYLLGGYKVNKTALAKNDNGDLLLSAVQQDEGAILFIIPASLPKSHFKNLYPKIDDSADSPPRKN